MTDQLIPTRRAFPADDPIFALNAEAQRRKAAGDAILNATVGALLDEAGQLVILDTVMDLWRGLGALDVAPYAPIAGDPAFLKALVQRHWPRIEAPGASCATPGGSGALSLSLRNFLEPGQTLLTHQAQWLKDLRSTLDSMATPCSVKAYGGWRRPPHELDMPIWHLKLSNSTGVS